MTQEITVENQMLDVLHYEGTCDLDEVMCQCAKLTWNQVLRAYRLSRRGAIRLMPRGLGAYTVAFPHRQEDRFDRLSLPS
jgi:hypothetical protein